MSRTSLVITFPSRYEATMADPPFRGSDWGGTVLPAGRTIPAGAPRVLLGSIGDPNATFETDHWGWIYFTLNPVDGGNAVQAQVFIHESHSDIKKFLLGYYSKDSSDGNPMPLGTFGEAVIEHEAPGGTVLYTVPASVPPAR
jgi:hypothetical protein